MCKGWFTQYLWCVLTDFQFQEYTISKTLYLENSEYFILFDNISGYLTRRNGMLEYSYNFPSVNYPEAKDFWASNTIARVLPVLVPLGSITGFDFWVFLIDPVLL